MLATKIHFKAFFLITYYVYDTILGARDKG